MKPTLSFIIKHTLASTLPALLLSCGGGGGNSNGDTPKEPTNTTLQVTIEAPATMKGGESITLTPHTNSSSVGLSYSWKIADIETIGKIENPNIEKATFQAVKVLNNSSATINLNVAEPSGKSAQTQHTIKIEVADEQKQYSEKIDQLEDPNLRSCILEHTARSTQELKNINCNKKDIETIKGLSQFTYITHLDLSANKISNLDELSAMHSITELRLDDNQTAQYSPIKDLNHLQYLSISSTKKEIDFSFLANNTTLKNLSINSITVETNDNINNTTRKASMILRATCTE